MGIFKKEKKISPFFCSNIAIKLFLKNRKITTILNFGDLAAFKSHLKVENFIF